MLMEKCAKHLQLGPLEKVDGGDNVADVSHLIINYLLQVFWFLSQSEKGVVLNGPVIRTISLVGTYSTFSMTRVSFFSVTCSLHAARFFTFSFSSFSSPMTPSSSVLKMCILWQEQISTFLHLNLKVPVRCVFLACGQKIIFQLQLLIFIPQLV